MFIIILLSIFPIIIWVFIEPLAFRFSDLNTITTSVGQILGLVGMVLFSINLILAGRLKFLDKYFHGLDKVYVNHSKIGVIAFSMILFHPLFLVVKYVTFSIKEASLFFVPFQNTPITWGIIALLLMIILISLTLYIKLKYHIWEMSHKFMTLAFLFALIHTLTIQSDISKNNILKFYIILLAFAGLIVSVRQAFFSKFINNKFSYRVNNIFKLNKDIIEIEMEPIGEKIVFKPGQFAFFSFHAEEIPRESHPFSVSSSILDNNLKITVKNLGDYTSLLNKLKKGDDVLIEGPYGDFSYKSIQNKNQIWIAGGIGISPFLSMTRVLENDYNVDLYYSIKENNEAVYSKEFEDFSRKNPNFKFNLWNATEKGYINSAFVSNLSKGLDSKDIFLCGPPIFMESLKNQFLSLGVDVKKIHYENFSF